ncbi:hypothetical protein LOZ66_006809 [Ophidiomyces ophidiicola]|nr:hypothetical protein LOZ66_006809 [Ophidiomyces ophidiicola]
MAVISMDNIRMYQPKPAAAPITNRLTQPPLLSALEAPCLGSPAPPITSLPQTIQKPTPTLPPFLSPAYEASSPNDFDRALEQVPTELSLGGGETEPNTSGPSRSQPDSLFSSDESPVTKIEPSNLSVWQVKRTSAGLNRGWISISGNNSFSTVTNFFGLVDEPIVVDDDGPDDFCENEPSTTDVGPQSTPDHGTNSSPEHNIADQKKRGPGYESGSAAAEPGPSSTRKFPRPPSPTQTLRARLRQTRPKNTRTVDGWTVDEVLDSRIVSRDGKLVLEYRICWADTWEPQDNLLPGCKPLVHAFHRKWGSKRPSMTTLAGMRHFGRKGVKYRHNSGKLQQKRP